MIPRPLKKRSGLENEEQRRGRLGSTDKAATHTQPRSGQTGKTDTFSRPIGRDRTDKQFNHSDSGHNGPRELSDLHEGKLDQLEPDLGCPVDELLHSDDDSLLEERTDISERQITGLSITEGYKIDKINLRILDVLAVSYYDTELRQTQYFQIDPPTGTFLQPYLSRIHKDTLIRSYAIARMQLRQHIKERGTELREKLEQIEKAEKEYA